MIAPKIKTRVAAPIAIKAIDVDVTVSPSSFVDLLSVPVFVVAGSELFFSDLSTGSLVSSFLETIPVKFRSESEAGRRSALGAGVVTSVVIEVAFSTVSLIFLQSLFLWDSRHCQSLLIPMSLQLFSLEDSETSEQQK